MTADIINTRSVQAVKPGAKFSFSYGFIQPNREIRELKSN